MGLIMYMDKIQGSWTQEQIVKWHRRYQQAYDISQETGDEFFQKHPFPAKIELKRWEKFGWLHRQLEVWYRHSTPAIYQKERFYTEYLVLTETSLRCLIARVDCCLREAVDGLYELTPYEFDELESCSQFLSDCLTEIDFQAETLLYFAH